MSPTLRGALLATLALSLVGSLVAASDTLEAYPLPEGQFLRYLTAAAILLALARGRLPRLTRREAAGLAGLAATGLVLFNFFVIEGVRETDPATVGVIVGCVPIVLAVAAPLLERRPVSGRVVLAGVVVSLGAAGVQWADGGITLLGLGLALGALACEAAFSLLAAPRLERLGPLAVSAYACLFALPLLAGWSLVAGGPRLVAPSSAELAAIGYLGAAVTTGGFVAWYSAVGLLGVERAGLFSGVLPVSALVCAALLGVASISPARLAAVGVVVAGITLGVRAVRGGDRAPQASLLRAVRPGA
ncbi:MAG TPA: DMT family transporter [Thermoleophilaceae bacterium]|nr:DMT family transporter [Thermoleophilaceae bacterium]